METISQANTPTYNTQHTHNTHARAHTHTMVPGCCYLIDHQLDEALADPALARYAWKQDLKSTYTQQAAHNG